MKKHKEINHKLRWLLNWIPQELTPNTDLTELYAITVRSTAPTCTLPKTEDR